jgi:predicted transcriptional regulator
MDDKLLTPAELEIMQVLWKEGEADIPAIHTAIGRDRAYTTVATLVRILEQKGYVQSHKDGKKLVYAPLTQAPHYEALSLKNLIGRLFGGKPELLVQRLVEDTSKEELDAIKKLIDGKEKKA